MNILSDLVKKNCDKMKIKTVFGEEMYCFLWNNPASMQDIDDFERNKHCSLPKDYRDFLLEANGAIIFKSEYEDDGYKLLSIEEMEQVTQEMKDDGYDIQDGCYCFMKCLFSEDVLLFDLRKQDKYIIDGDVAYPSDEWEYVSADVNTFFLRLCQCNGAMYWRW